MNRLTMVCVFLALLGLTCCSKSTAQELGQETSEKTKPVVSTSQVPAVPTEPVPIQETIQPTPSETAQISDGPLKITIIYDNYPFDPELRTEWGFSALIELKEQTILFDTGGDGSIFLDNMEKLSIDPSRIDLVVLSHGHGDHIGGIEALYNTRLQAPVYVLNDFASPIRQRVGAEVEVITISGAQRIAEGIHTTGRMSRGIPEQSLVIQGPQGLVVITGCAHPGISEIVDQAKAMFDQPIDLVMGGFHLRETSAAERQAIIDHFDQLGVVSVAPSHCTGDMAIRDFREHYQNQYLKLGVGRIIIIE